MDKLIARFTVTLNIIVMMAAIAGLNVVLTKEQYMSAAAPGFLILCNGISIRAGYRLHRVLSELDQPDTSQPS
jgi:hypothetical protein